MKFKKIKNNKGFAIMTVLLMTVVLLILLVSLISLTSQTLYRATADVERASVVPVAESAVSEVILRFRENLAWGEAGTERVLMRTGGQDVRAAGLDSAGIAGASPSIFSFKGKSCYYVSFKKDDSAFTGTKYYSVNNLDSPNPNTNWAGEDIPPHSASIVITVAAGNTAKHIEVLLQTVPQGGMQQGSRGKALFKAKEFLMKQIGSSTPNFHSNFQDASDPSIDFQVTSEVKLDDNSTISAHGTIDSTVSPTGGSFKPNEPAQSIPVLAIDSLVSAVSFAPDPIPSGIYTFTGGHWEYKTDPAATPTVYPAGSVNVVDGFFLKDDGEVLISKSLKVDYDAGHGPGECGNLNIKGAKKVEFTTSGLHLYAEGDGTSRDFSDPNAPYLYGNIDITDCQDEVMKGYGNLYAKGSITLRGEKAELGGASDDVCLFAQGDITLEATTDKFIFQGLIYTFGDFFCSCPNDILVSGALLAAGKDPNDPGYSYDPGNLLLDSTGGGKIEIQFDDSKLGPISGGGVSSGFIFLSWREF